MSARTVTKEDFELEEGLVDDFDGTIVEAKFGENEEYAAISGSSDPMLILTIESPDVSTPISQSYSTGASKRWSITDRGRGIESEAKPESVRFNKNARAGQLVAAMVLAAGGGDLNKGQEFFMKRGHVMVDAAFYEGLNFHWNRQDLSTVGGETRSVLLPSAFLGEVGGAAPAKKGASAAKAAPAAKASELPQDLIDQVVELADGKTLVELKKEVVKTLDKKNPGYNAVVREVLSGKLTEKLCDDGILFVGEGDRFMKVA